jgi:hypothetical protein
MDRPKREYEPLLVLAFFNGSPKDDILLAIREKLF